MSGPVDALKVGLGIDLTGLDSKLAAAKSQIDKQLPKERVIEVTVRVRPNQYDVRNFHQNLERGLQRLPAGRQLQIPATFKIDPNSQSWRNARRQVENDLRQAGARGSINVPIKPVISGAQFTKDIQAAVGIVTIPIYGKFMGWGPGGGPPTGGAGGGRTGGGGGRTSGGGGGRAPEPTATGAPVRARAQQMAPSPVYQAQPAYARTGGVEERSSDVYSVPLPPAIPQRTANKANRREARRTNAQGVVQRNVTRTAPGNRPYVTTTNVRYGQGEQELQGDDRAAYTSQLRARPTPALGYAEQPGERTYGPGGTSRVRPGASSAAHLRQEEIAQADRRSADEARLGSAGFAAAQQILSDFDPTHPGIADALALQGSGSPTGTYGSYSETQGLRIEASRGIRGARTKQQRRSSRRVGGFTGKDIRDRDLPVLAEDAAMAALRAQQELAIDPLAAVRSGDQKLRGKGGKVGRIGGRNAGRLATESVEPSAVQEILQRRRVGGKGNGWKSLQGEFSAAEISAARGMISANAVREAPDEIVPGRAYGGGAEMYAEGTAPSVYGGQGLFERDTKLAPTVGKLEDRFLTGEGRETIPRGQSRAAAFMDLRRAQGRSSLSPFVRRPNLFFAEGGSLFGMRELRLGLKYAGPGLRVGSIERQALEQQLQTRLKNRDARSKKPLYQQGGLSDPQWRNRAGTGAADKFLRESGPGAPCYWCGRPTVPGDPQRHPTVDHLVDTASGGAMYDPANLVIADREHNGQRSGGRSKRQMTRGSDAWSGDRSEYENDLASFRLRQGYAEGGRMMWKRGKGYAEGGILKSGGLLMRMAQAGHEPSITRVGERGPEDIVTDPHTGESEVVPTHKVPLWRQRMLEGHGAKDMTGYAEGGSLNYVNAGGGRYQSGGRFVTAAGAAFGQIQRVFVVNWPPNLSGQAGVGSTARGARQRAQANAPTQEEQEQTYANQPPGAPNVGASRVRVTPTSRVGARDVAERATSGLSERIQLARGLVSERLSESPVRALSVTFGQIAQQLVGGRAEIQQRARTANATLSAAERARGQQQTLLQSRRESHDKLEALRAAGATPAELAAEREQYDQFGAGAKAVGAKAAKLTARGEAQANKVLTPGELIKTQAVGLGGIIAGTATFTAAIAAFQVATAAADTALSPLVDQLTGFAGSLQKVTAAITQGIRAGGGSAQAAAAGLAPSGISAAFVSQQGGGIVGRAQANAASAALLEQSDIVRAARGSGRGRLDAGLFGGTGGLLGSGILTEQLGGQAGVLENLTKTLRPTINPAPFDRGRNPTGLENATIESLNKNLKSAAEVSGDVSSQFKLVAGATDDQIEAMKKSALETFKQTGNLEVLNRAQELAAIRVAPTQNGQGLTGAQFGQFAQQLAIGATYQDPALLLQQTQNQRKAQYQASIQQGLFSRQQDIPASTFLQGNAQPLGRFGTTFSTQGLTGAEGAKTLQNIEKYTKMAGEASSKYVQLVQAGQGPAEGIVSRIDTPGGGRGGPLGRGTGTGPSVSRFRELNVEINKTGTEIQQITDDLNSRQTTATVLDYNEQIRLTKRGLQDAKDLWAGIQGAEIKTVGGLQGANILLDRQNQLLSRRQARLGFKSEDIGFKSSDLQVQLQQLQFGQTQRQINFSKAIAGFAAPGTTPGERAERVKDAEAEANFAQKQLNLQEAIAKQGQAQLAIAKQQAGINREIFANQVKSQDNSFAAQIQEAKRAIPDLAHQLDSLSRQRAITIDAAAAQETIARLEKAIQPAITETQDLLQQGEAARTSVLQDLTNLSAQTGKDMRDLVSSVEDAWTKAAQSYVSNFLDPVQQNIKDTFGIIAQATANAFGGFTGTSRPNQTHKPSAAGTNTYVDQPTRFTAGDAGGEQVIVLRNPKSGMMMGSGGGGGGIVFNGGINVTVVGGTGDDDKTADRLARKVEERITRRLSMIAG